MDCSAPDSSVYGDSPGKNAGVGCHALLQGIFPTQGLNPGLPPCRWILCHQNHQGSPLFFSELHYCPKRVFWDCYPERFMVRDQEHQTSHRFSQESHDLHHAPFLKTLEVGIAPLWHCLHLGPVGDCPGHCRAVSSIPGSYPPGFGRIPTHPRAVTTPNISRLCQMSLWREATLSLIQNLWPSGKQFYHLSLEPQPIVRLASGHLCMSNSQVPERSLIPTPILFPLQLLSSWEMEPHTAQLFLLESGVILDSSS